MKKVLVCGMLLGLLTSVSYAQRGHAIGGVGTSARIPDVGPVSPNARTSPNALSVGHDGVMPNATTTGKNPTHVGPNATFDPTARTVGPNTKTADPSARTVGPNTVTTVPDRVITPDATGPGPDR
ncbi:MAG: hypothetical protein ACLPPV_17675 [Candidatus Korobacteraceae bacterium]|jgi:hypothetical protein